MSIVFCAVAMVAWLTYAVACMRPPRNDIQVAVGIIVANMWVAALIIIRA